MWKTTTQTALIALSLVTFGTGCDLAEFINNIGGGGGIDIGVEPPTTVPPIDDCEIQLDQCLQNVWGDPTLDVQAAPPADEYWDPTGRAEQDCYDAYDVCIDVTLPPPPPTCETELDDCLASIYDLNDTDIELPPGQADMPYYDPAEQACYEAYDDCTDVQPPPPPIDDCDIELDLCLQDIWMDPSFMPGAEEVCFDRYAVCIDDTVPPPPPVDACEQLFSDCLDNGVSFGLCEQVLDECVVNADIDDDTDPVEPVLPPMP